MCVYVCVFAEMLKIEIKIIKENPIKENITFMKKTFKNNINLQQKRVRICIILFFRYVYCIIESFIVFVKKYVQLKWWTNNF